MRKVRCQDCRGTKVIAKIGGLHELSCPTCEGKGHMYLVDTNLCEDIKEIEQTIDKSKKKSKRDNEKEVA